MRQKSRLGIVHRNCVSFWLLSYMWKEKTDRGGREGKGRIFWFLSYKMKTPNATVALLTSHMDLEPGAKVEQLASSSDPSASSAPSLMPSELKVATAMKAASQKICTLAVCTLAFAVNGWYGRDDLSAYRV